MLVYKIDVLETLKENGYNTTKLRKEKLLGENSIQYLRENKMIGTKALNTVCKLLDMQPGNIIRYIDDENIKNNVK
ncbi:MAG: helix-turn-helix transcriptional regulator [Lachnospiraceae bacterium]|nr:helix-turn-helix transcriptional regulator [Lachnospiraceae bacterium]